MSGESLTTVDLRLVKLHRDLHAAPLDSSDWVASSPAIAVIHSDPYFHVVSPQCEDLLGWTPEEMCERPFKDFVHPHDVTVTERYLVRALTDPDLEGVDFLNRYRVKPGTIPHEDLRPDGRGYQWCWLYWQGVRYPLVEEDQGAVWISVALDVTHGLFSACGFLDIVARRRADGNSFAFGAPLSRARTLDRIERASDLFGRRLLEVKRHG